MATAQTVAAQRLRHSIEASEQERRRWARELHDETLQGLGALHVILDGALRSGEPDAVVGAARQGLAQLEEEIDKLQVLIAELRPASLDELGLRAAIEGLADRTASVEGLDIHLELELLPQGLDPELDSAIYRLCQEALTNVAKHARAEHVEVRLLELGGRLELEVADDGQGFEPGRGGGYGLIGMAERAELMGGTLEIASKPGSGTTIRVSLPRVAPRT